MTAPRAPTPPRRAGGRSSLQTLPCHNQQFVKELLGSGALYRVFDTWRSLQSEVMSAVVPQASQEFKVYSGGITW